MDLHYIVDQLNAPPFQYNLSLLSLRHVICRLFEIIHVLIVSVYFRSEKSSQECLQLLSDVFAQISPKQKVPDIENHKAVGIQDLTHEILKLTMHACFSQKIDVSKEEPEQTADRLVQFLKIVKYKPPASLDP